MNRVEMVINYLNENVNQRLNIDTIANIAYLSPVQLYRVFKKTTGLTPIQYHEQLKIKESLNLLPYSEKISDVAFDLGYENYETFSRAFKKICNCTPSDFLWGNSFINSQPNYGNYALVKEDASLYHIKQLITESKDFISDVSHTLIYRLHPQTKGKPKIKRCTRSEEFIRLNPT